MEGMSNIHYASALLQLQKGTISTTQIDLKKNDPNHVAQIA
jgi:hypothetical protein